MIRVTWTQQARVFDSHVMYDHLDRMIAVGHRHAILFDGKRWAYVEHGFDDEKGRFIRLERDATERLKEWCSNALLGVAAAGVILGLTTCANDAHAETDLMVFGASRHFNVDIPYDYNEFNAGAGIEWRRSAESPWIVGGFAVHDSMRQLGGAAYVGYRLRHDLGRGWHVEATLRAGYLRDAYYSGPAVLPAVGIGYKRLTIEATVVPKIGPILSNAVVVWGRWSF